MESGYQHVIRARCRNMLCRVIKIEKQTIMIGIRISGSCPEPGIFIVEILEDSITALDGRIKVIVVNINIKSS